MTFNTGNPIGSTDARDRSDNSKFLDEVVNSLDLTKPDRLGRTRDTLEGIYQKSAYYRVGTFDAGYTLTNSRQTLAYGQIEYSWSGEFPKVVPTSPSTSPENTGGVGAGAWVDRTQETLRGELLLSTGLSNIKNGDLEVDFDVNSIKPLSFYGSDQYALVQLLNYAKATGKPIRLTSDVTITSLIDIDFSGAKLVLYCQGFSLLSDTTCLRIRNLARNSIIDKPSLKNIATPWCITRWDSIGGWIEKGSDTLATLAQTNAEGYYQPSGNDNDIWSSLNTQQQNQNISPKIEIYTSTGVTISNPSGRFALIEFYGCNDCTIENPENFVGGKGVLGTIVFNNTNSAAWGYGNKVIGGSVKYGSFSGVVFLRNKGKSGGVWGDYVPYRNGESGVKTWQGELNGVSARCYELTFDSIYPYQTFYDGVDFCSDYGDTPVERVSDYTLSQYPWHQLPTKHAISNVQAFGCNQCGVWGDGRFNDYESISAENCLITGIKNIGKYQSFKDIAAINCNLSNAETGEHQILIGDVNDIDGVRVIVEDSSGVTHGYGLYAPSCFVSDIKTTLIFPSTIGKMIVKAVITAESDCIVGHRSYSDNTTKIGFNPRMDGLANPIGYVGGDVYSGVSGAESGAAWLKGVKNGAEVKGIIASGDGGGVALLSAADSTASGTWLQPGQYMFYETSGHLHVIWKKLDGTTADALLV